ncbi:MAG: citramalate synthase [Candidatus Omnitrophica bacterium]|nr:citramalate synthase [Candidatus Omnitrophota bacterium]
MNRVKLYDTTLRDGAQSEGISFTVSDKLRIASKVDALGLGYIEGGWPGSNPKDMEFFRKAKHLKLNNSRVVAFGSTRRARTKVSEDANVNALLKTDTEIITIFGKSWDLHVKEVLKVTLDENLELIEDTIKYLKSKGRKVFYDAEHFFDGYIRNPQYALKTVSVAEKSGADIVILCDTNGGMITSEVFKVIRDVREKLKVPLGMHAHNDSDMAVANSIAAVQAGCTHVQGTINGYGERCGNANLISVIANLKTKLGIDCISDISLRELSEASKFVSEIANLRHMDNQPFVGNSAFAHKGGIHVDAILKNPVTYEHIEPTKVGNRRRVLISELSGKSSITAKAKELDLELKKDTDRAKKILNLVQNMEHKGYHFEVAEASLELLMKRAKKEFKDFFKLQDFRVIIEKRPKGKITSEATIKLKVKGSLEHTASLGDGPVNALDNALRKALKDFYPNLSQMHLSDYKVRVLDEKEGTAAKVRVLIQSQDKKDSWWTVGVSENIIEASWEALVDSVEYKLLKDSQKQS